MSSFGENARKTFCFASAKLLHQRYIWRSNEIYIQLNSPRISINAACMLHNLMHKFDMEHENQTKCVCVFVCVKECGLHNFIKSQQDSHPSNSRRERKKNVCSPNWNSNRPSIGNIEKYIYWNFSICNHLVWKLKTYFINHHHRQKQFNFHQQVDVLSVEVIRMMCHLFMTFFFVLSHLSKDPKL